MTPIRALGRFLRRRAPDSPKNLSTPLRVIPIGGLEEVGKNSMIVEYGQDILAIDMGFQFPEPDMYGVDYVIPDIQYLVERKKNLKGILITHGHLDHIGGLPFVLADLGFPPIYGSSLSIGLIQKQLEEHKLLKQAKLKVVNNQQSYSFGQIQVEFFRVNHSIPDSLGIFLRSPAGTMVHTGDFKFDFTPADGVEADIAKMKDLGDRGVDLLFSDSTNATKPGHTLSEKVIGENLNHAISNAEGRIIIASFSSLIGRIQQVLEFAVHHNRKVFVSGRSMEDNMEIATKLGFLKIPKGLVKPIRSIKDYPDHEVMVVTTGSQGEPMAALSRMASNSHQHVQIRKGDTVVVSSTPILGNEKAVYDLVNELCRLGAKVVHNRIMDVHTSGHGNQEDLKMMLGLIRPKHFVPVHGNFMMRRAHGDLGLEVGLPEDHVHMMDNGNVIELHNTKVKVKREEIKVRYLVVDGLGRGDLGSVVQKERASMAHHGLVHVVFKIHKGRLVGNPVVSSSGFVYQKESLKILASVEQEAKKFFAKHQEKAGRVKEIDLKKALSKDLGRYIAKRLGREPIVHTMFINI